MEETATPKDIGPQERPSYWFPRRRYGWGWGLPYCWQGWAVFLVYALVLWACDSHLRSLPTLHVAAPLAATGVLIWICYRKGEPPQWRCGQDDPPSSPHEGP